MLKIGFIDNIKELFKDKQFFYKYLGITTIISIISYLLVILVYVPIIPMAILSEEGNVEQYTPLFIVLGIIAAVVFIIFILAITIYSVSYVFQFFQNLKEKVVNPLPNPFVSKSALIQGTNLMIASTIYGLITFILFGVPMGLIIWVISTYAEEGTALMILMICISVVLYIIYFLFALFFSSIISPALIYHIKRYGLKGGFMIGSIWNMAKKYFKDLALSFLKYAGLSLAVGLILLTVMVVFQVLMYIPFVGIIVSFIYAGIALFINIPIFHLMFSYYKTIYPIFEVMDKS